MGGNPAMGGPKQCLGFRVKITAVGIGTGLGVKVTLVGVGTEVHFFGQLESESELESEPKLA